MQQRHCDLGAEEVDTLTLGVDSRQAAVRDLRPDLLIAMYRTMLRIRLFEEKAGDLVETGEIACPVHLYIGQEAVATGVCAALKESDYVWGNHRSHGHYLAKGGDMNALMAELFCKRDGCARGRGGSMHVYAGHVGVLGTGPMVGATIPIAVGAALSATMRNTDQVSVAFFGDGATEEGVFHESVNFAALQKLPTIFVCENNLYSSHLPLSARRAVEELCLHAVPYGIPGVRVDGNDAMAVYEAAMQAVTRARGGQGPSLLECMTYRWRGHVGPHLDLERGIRSREELDAWMNRCPIDYLGRCLVQADLATENELEAIREAVQSEVEASVSFARCSPYPESHEVVKHVFASRE